MYNYTRFEDEESRVIFAGVFLKGIVAKQFEPYTKRYYKYETFTKQKEKDEFRRRYLTDIFNNFKCFITTVTTKFGELDAKRRLEQKLLNLRQKTSVTAYATEFRVEVAKTKLGEKILVMFFWQGLKQYVTDELYKLDRPKTFQPIVEFAIRTDNHYFDY